MQVTSTWLPMKILPSFITLLTLFAQFLSTPASAYSFLAISSLPSLQAARNDSLGSSSNVGDLCVKC
jgi:hypothetical protein